MLRHLQFSSLIAEQLDRESFAACVWSAKRHAVCREVCRLSMRSGRKGPNGLDRGGGNAGWAVRLGRVMNCLIVAGFAVNGSNLRG
jgi:hypothetical protein